MTHNIKACLHDTVSACRLIIRFTEGISLQEYQESMLVKSAVERQFDILGEALNRIKKLDSDFLKAIPDSQKIIAFRNVIAHGYDAIDDEIIYLFIQKRIPVLLTACKELLHCQILEESLIQTAEKLGITANHYGEALKKIEDLGMWFASDESSVKNYSPKIYPHGSFLLGTLIKPITDEDEYSIDLVCQLDLKDDSMTQKKFKELVGLELRKYVLAKGILGGVQEGKRCWKIKIDDESQFHLNILPATTSSNAIRRDFSDTEIAITDNSLPSYSSVDIEWPRSNPKGFALWFTRQMKSQSLEKQLLKAKDRGSPIDDGPENSVKTVLQIVVQILKRHRDVVFAGKNSKPLSIIITALAAMAYDGEASVIESLRGILARFESCFSRINGKMVLRNPVDEAELLTAVWMDSDEKEFFEWLEFAKKNIFSWIVEGDYT